MKLKTLAVAVALTAAGSQAFATELYNQNGGTLEMGGRAEARLSIKDGEGADNSRVRLNFLGKQEINSNGLYGVGYWEGEFKASGDEIDNRYVYAGMGGKFGEITYGKNDGALQVLNDFTDIMSYHGGNQAKRDREEFALSYRADNMLSYKGQFDNLGLKASYRFEGQGNEEINGTEGNGTDGYSLSATYAFADTGFEVGAGYADQEEMDEYMIVAGYTIGNFYMAANFTGGDFQDSDYEAFELAAAYTMNKTVFSASYNNEDVDNEEEVDALAIDVTYYFKPNFRGYASYNFDLLDNDSDEDQDELALGLRYDF